MQTQVQYMWQLTFQGRLGIYWQYCHRHYILISTSEQHVCFPFHCISLWFLILYWSMYMHSFIFVMCWYGHGGHEDSQKDWGWSGNLYWMGCQSIIEYLFTPKESIAPPVQHLVCFREVQNVINMQEHSKRCTELRIEYLVMFWLLFVCLFSFALSRIT